jgi:hypothetical protein
MSGPYPSHASSIGGSHPAVVRRRIRDLMLIGVTGLIALVIAMGIVAAVPSPSFTLMIAVVIGVAGIIYLMVNPRLEVTVAILWFYLGCLDGPVKLVSGGGTTVSSLRDVLIFAVCLGAILRHLATKERTGLPPLSAWVLGFVLIVLLEALNPNTNGALKILGGFRQQLEWVPFFFFGYLLIRSKQRLRKLFILLAVIATANAVVSVYQVRLSPHQLAAWGPGYSEKVLGANGVSGTTFASGGTGRVRPLALGSDIGFGGAVGVIALPGALVLLATAAPRRRWIFMLLSLAALLSIGVSLSRTAVLGSVVTLISFALLSLSTGRRFTRPLAGLVVVLLLSIPLASVLTSTVGTAIFSRYSSIAGSQAASSSTGYKSASLAQIPVVVANDPFGFGLGTAGAASSFGGRTTVTLEGHGFSSETEFNFIMNEMGLPGLLLWISFSVYLGVLVVRRLSRVSDIESRLALAAVFSVLAGLTVMGFAGAVTAGSAGGPYFWLAAGIAAYWLAGRGAALPATVGKRSGLMATAAGAAG